ERPCLAGRVVRADAHAGELGARGARASAVYVDDRDGVAFEVDLRALARGHCDEFAVRARLDPEGPGLDRNAGRDFHDRNARERALQVHYRYVVGTGVAGEEIGPAVAAVPQGEELRIRPATELRVGGRERNDGRGRG